MSDLHIFPSYLNMIHMARFDCTTLDPGKMYRLLIGAVVPRPIAFVSTIDAKGHHNLAPFSFFNAVSSKPPALLFCITAKPDGSEKDTLRNILETKEFVVNSANEWFLDELNQCAANFPHGVSEFEKSGLTPVTSDKVRAPRVKEAAISMECTLIQTVQVGDGSLGSSTIVIGRILVMHIDDKVLDGNGLIDITKLKPMARLGGLDYSALGPVITKPRP